MINYQQGDLLKAEAEALVNTVNTEGVMGRGIALQFKMKYPEMFKAYAAACKRGEVRLGQVQAISVGDLLSGQRWVINFPTKGHWRSDSRLEDIASGLQDLLRVCRELGIRSIAIPPLGCGLGGLDWIQVRPLIEAAFSGSEIRALVFAPQPAPAAAKLENNTARPKMTEGRAAMIALMNRYLQAFLDPCFTLLELHKMMYFLQVAGQPLKLNYTKGLYGPYADNLGKVLRHVESHFVEGFGDGGEQPGKELRLLPGAVDEAEGFLAEAKHELLKQRMDRIQTLIEGYEDPVGMELLSTMHWVMTEDHAYRDDVELAVQRVHQWNERKARVLKPESLRKAWKRLKDHGWVA